MNKKEIKVEKPSISGIIFLIVGVILAALLTFLAVDKMHKYGLPRDHRITQDASIGKPGRGD